MAKRHEGFSIMELLTVLSVIGIMFVMMAPSLSSFLPSVKFHATVRQLTTDIAFNRLRAVERNETATITYNASTRTYTLNPYGLKRTIPLEVESVTIPTITFNSRGLMTTETAVVVTVTGRGGRLLGMNDPVNVLQTGDDVTEIVNIAAVSVVEAQVRETRARKSTP